MDNTPIQQIRLKTNNYYRFKYHIRVLSCKSRIGISKLKREISIDIIYLQEIKYRNIEIADL